jgi:4-hydroxy-2-oxoheptanedioate aldolase
MSHQLPPTIRQVVAAANRPLIGMFVSSGSPIVAEICAGSGIDWIFVDGEHAPLGLESIATMLQVIAAYPVTALVRVPTNDPVIIKQYLDLGAQNIIVPMVDTPEQAEAAVRAAHYPPRGIRGLGAGVSRSARWGRVGNYLATAADHVSVIVQIESAEAVAHAAEIAAIDGVAALFVGPADLSASMGLLGQESHPDVVAAVLATFAAAASAGKPVAVNAFDPARAHAYMDAGATLVSVAADVTMLARGTEALAREFAVDPR